MCIGARCDESPARARFTRHGGRRTRPRSWDHQLARSPLLLSDKAHNLRHCSFYRLTEPFVSASLHLEKGPTGPKRRIHAAPRYDPPRGIDYGRLSIGSRDHSGVRAEESEAALQFGLTKQGTELVALQRDNLDLCHLAPADISKQIPAWSLLTSAYLFRDADHLKKTFKSDVGQEFIKMAKDQLGIQVISPVYFGSRNVNLKPTKEIKMPADMAGIKLRMPPGEFWQFLGESLGANPTPVAYAELYTALQTGTVDGQDNPLVASKLMKFDEVTSQFVLTKHVIGYDVMSIRSKIWDAMSAVEQEKFRVAAEKAMDENTARFNAQEAEVIEYFKKEGKRVYEPDQNAFRVYAQKKYVEKYGKDWPKDALERINAVN